MNMSPAVTILMSVYNGDKYLREAIDSILNQTFNDFEFIIINDASTDKTKDILDSYEDKRIKIINNTENIGLTKSLNIGIKSSNGRYIARMDADDISLPERLETEKRFLDQNKNIGMVGTYYYFISSDGKIIETITLPTDNKELQEKLIEQNQFGHGTVMFRSECIYKIGPYREEFKYSQDYDFWLRISEVYEIANIPIPLYKWRLNKGSISANKKIEQDIYASLARELANERRQNGKDKLEILSGYEKDSFIRNYIDTQKFDNQDTANSCYSWGESLYYRKKYSESLKYLFRSVLHKPFNNKSWPLIKEILKISFIQIISRIKYIINKHILKRFSNN